MRVETFATPRPLRLELTVPAGRLEVEAVGGGETRVEIEGEPDAEEAVSVRLRGDELVVSVEEERFLLVFTKVPEVRVRVACPHGSSLGARVVSADVRAAGRLAAAEVKSVSGDVQLEQVEGDARVKTVSGDAYLGTVGGRAVLQSVSGDLAAERVGGRVDVHTVSGDVRVDEAAGDVSGHTVSGDLRFGSLAQGAVSLRSVSGDMILGIRAGSRLWVDARSASGKTSSELPLADLPLDGEGPLVELRATAMSGDIRIVRAA